MADPLEQVRAKIQARLDELRAEEAQLNRALVHLAGSDSGRAPGKRKAGKTKRGSSKGTKRGARQAEMLNDIRQNPGTTAADSGKRIGIGSTQAHGVASRLVEKKQVVKKMKGGVARFTIAKG